MNTNFLKYSIILTVILISVLFIPAHLPSRSGKPGKDEAIIRFQECGCPCPDAFVIDGQFTVPDSLTGKLKRKDFVEIYLTNDSDITFEDSQHNIKIKGKISGADPDFCDGNDCYYLPIVRIDSWEIAEYVSWFWYWNKNFAIGYLLTTLISIVITIILVIVKIVDKVSNRNSRKAEH